MTSGALFTQIWSERRVHTHTRGRPVPGHTLCMQKVKLPFNDLAPARPGSHSNPLLR